MHVKLPNLHLVRGGQVGYASVQIENLHYYEKRIMIPRFMALNLTSSCVMSARVVDFPIIETRRCHEAGRENSYSYWRQQRDR